MARTTTRTAAARIPLSLCCSDDGDDGRERTVEIIEIEAPSLDQGERLAESPLAGDRLDQTDAGLRELWTVDGTLGLVGRAQRAVHFFGLYVLFGVEQRGAEQTHPRACAAAAVAQKPACG